MVPQWTTPPAWVTSGVLRAPAISSPPGTTVLLRIAIIEAPPAMPQASVLGDNAPAAEPAVHTWRMVTFRREIRLRHETGVTQRALTGLMRVIGSAVLGQARILVAAGG